MIEINLNTVEQLILQDSRLRSLLSDLQGYFDSWLLGQRNTSFKNLANRSKVDLLNSLNDNHLAILKKYFDTEVTVRYFDTNIVINKSIVIENLEDSLKELQDYAEICLYRKANQVSLTAWR